MSRFLLLGLLLVLTACGGGKRPPSNLENACAIARERPAYLRAMKKAERKWGVPVPTQMAVIYQESKFDSDARTPLRYSLGVIPMGRQSSAFGYAQALDATWEEYKRDTRNPRAKRDRITDATDFMGWYMNITKEKNGIALSDTRNQYLAYHEGHTGYARGSYNRKAWLVKVANSLDSRADTYEAQLRSCRKL